MDPEIIIARLKDNLERWNKVASNENTPESVLNAPQQTKKVIPKSLAGQVVRNKPRRGKKVKRHNKEQY